MAIASSYTIFLALAVLLVGLWLASHRISLLIQENVYLLTGSLDMAMVILFLIYVPGILIHEGAHWAMAKVLGLKTGAFRVWPRKQGKYIGMGSVSVGRGDPVRESLVGMAPLMVGSALVVVIGEHAFNTRALGALWRGGSWLDGSATIYDALLFETDALLWAYLIFTIANAMLPSASDREPVRSLLRYVALCALLYFLLDQSGRLLLRMADWLVAPVQILASAFLFTLVIDLVIIALLYTTQAVIVVLRAPAPRT